MSQALDSLRLGQDSDSITEHVTDIQRFTEQCSLGFAQRYLAAQKDAYPLILSYCKKCVEDKDTALPALRALAALTDGQPDLLDAKGQQFLLDVLKKYQEDSLVMRAAVLVVRHCCLKHEQNRQDLVKGGVLPLLTTAVKRHVQCAEVVKEVSAALRVMTFDDDVRATFGHAHEHAKMIVLENNALKVLIEAAKGIIIKIIKFLVKIQLKNGFCSFVAAHQTNTSVLSELCATLARLAVRNEFCQDICDLGGLKFMVTLLSESYETAVIYKNTNRSETICLCSAWLNCFFFYRSWFVRS